MLWFPTDFWEFSPDQILFTNQEVEVSHTYVKGEYFLWCPIMYHLKTHINLELLVSTDKMLGRRLPTSRPDYLVYVCNLLWQKPTAVSSLMLDCQLLSYHTQENISSVVPWKWMYKGLAGLRKQNKASPVMGIVRAARTLQTFLLPFGTKKL